MVFIDYLLITVVFTVAWLICSFVAFFWRRNPKKRNLKGALIYIFSLNVFKDIKDYFTTTEGREIARGVLVVFCLVLISGFLGIVGCASKGTYFNDASIYAGLDYTNGSNPFAEGGGLDDRTVSNVGVRFNAYRTYDQLNEVNIKTTHHSAAFNTDLDTYDSVGFEMVHKFYTRKQYGRHY